MALLQPKRDVFGFESEKHVTLACGVADGGKRQRVVPSVCKVRRRSNAKSSEF